MKIKLNSFAAAISVVFALFAAASLFIRTSDVSATPMFWFSFSHFHPEQPLISLLVSYPLLAAPLLQLILIFSCKRCALPSLLVPLCCTFASVAIVLVDNLIINFFSIYYSFLTAIFALLIVFCIIFYKNAAKTALSIFFLVIALAMIIAAPFGLYKYLNIDILLYLANMFLSLGMLCLALEPKVKFTALPDEPEEQPEITVKVESASLSQTLESLLDKYNKGEISKEEYDALKRETLWKI